MGPVLPDMVDPLNSTPEAVGWVMGVYTLSNALFMLLLGTRIDNLARKKVLTDIPISTVSIPGEFSQNTMLSPSLSEWIPDLRLSSPESHRG